MGAGGRALSSFLSKKTRYWVFKSFLVPTKLLDKLLLTTDLRWFKRWLFLGLQMSAIPGTQVYFGRLCRTHAQTQNNTWMVLTHAQRPHPGNMHWTLDTSNQKMFASRRFTVGFSSAVCLKICSAECVYGLGKRDWFLIKCYKWSAIPFVRF